MAVPQFNLQHQTHRCCNQSKFLSVFRPNTRSHLTINTNFRFPNSIKPPNIRYKCFHFHIPNSGSAKDLSAPNIPKAEVLERWVIFMRSVLPGGSWWNLSDSNELGSKAREVKPVTVLLALRRIWALVADDRWVIYAALVSLAIVAAIQHAHSLSMQAFENKEKLSEMEKECAALQKQNKSLKNKMKILEDQAEAAAQAKQEADEKTEAAEAIKNVAEAEKKEAQAKAAQAEQELHEALATKDAEIKAANDKAYAQGMADVAEDYKLQVKQAFNKGFSFGWMTLAKKLDLPADSPWRKAEAIPLPYPPPPPSTQVEEEADSEAEAEDEDENINDEEALVRKSMDAAEVKSPPPVEQILDLTQDEEAEEVPKESDQGYLSSDLLLAERSLSKTLAEIDAEVAAEKAAEEVAEAQTQTVPEVEETQV